MLSLSPHLVSRRIQKVNVEAGGVGILTPTDNTSLNARNVKNSTFAEVGYTAGTRDFEVATDQAPAN